MWPKHWTFWRNGTDFLCTKIGDFSRIHVKNLHEGPLRINKPVNSFQFFWCLFARSSFYFYFLRGPNFSHDLRADFYRTSTLMEGTDPNFCILCYFLNLNRKPPASSELLLLGVKNNSFNFSSTWQTSWGCAGDAWGVPVRVVELRGIKGCNVDTHGGKPYQPGHASCGIKRIVDAFRDSGGSIQALKDLKLQQMPRWIFFFDADTLPLPNMDLQKFVKDSNPSLFLFEDFQTGAIYPDTFLVRVDEYSQSFFKFVDEFYHSLRDTSKVDRLQNSAFEAAVLHWLKDELSQSRNLQVNESIKWVDSRFSAIRDPQTYDRYIATARYVLGPKRRFEHLALLRRGHGFCLDMSDMAGFSGQSPFFCFKTHAALAPQDVDAACLAKVSICQEWISECMLTPLVPKLHAEKIRHYKPQRMGLGMVNDVESCWPSCDPDVPADVWRDLEMGLHFNAKCANGHCRQGCCCNDIDIISEQRAADSADAFLLALVVSISVIILILCWIVSRKRSRRNQGPTSPRPFKDLTSPRTISIEMTPWK